MNCRTLFLTIALLCALSTSAGAEERSGAPLVHQIREVWGDVLQGISERDLKKVHDASSELDTLRVQAGFSDLEDYSLFLSDEGTRRLEMGDIELAAFYAKKALQLSPNSPSVAFRTLPLVHETGVVPLMGQLSFVLSRSWRDPRILLTIVNNLTYLLIWGALFGLYLAFVLHFSYHIKAALTSVARLLPHSVMGLAAPVITFFILAVPCVLGPVWCLGVWSLIVLMLSTQRRWLTFLTGALFVVMAVVIPLREQLGAWLRDEGVQSMLRVSEGAFSDLDRTRLASMVNRRGGDPVAAYVYGQFLRKHEQWDDAERAFLTAEGLLGQQGWTIAQRGLIQFLKGNPEEASHLFEKAEREGLRTPQLLFNYSKIKFELLDTEGSMQLSLDAQRMDPRFMSEMKQREEVLKRKAVAEISLPPHVVVRESLDLSAPLPSASLDRITHLLKGGSVRLLLISGVILIALFFVVGEKKRRARFHSYYSRYKPSPFLESFLRFLPGGAWIIVGKPASAAGIMGVFFVMAFPLIGWPYGSDSLLDALPIIKPWYAVGLAIFWLVVCFIGYAKENEV